MKTSSRLNLPLWLIAAVIATILPAAMLILSAQTSHAGSATWLASPADNNWNNAANWTPGGPPNGSSDTATFAFSNITTVRTGSGLTEVNGIVYNAGASVFTIYLTDQSQLTISGVGITDNSGTSQIFLNTTGCVFHGHCFASRIVFRNSATAGDANFDNHGGMISGGPVNFIIFAGTSTAGNGSFSNFGGNVSGAAGGRIDFIDGSTANNAILQTVGGASGAGGGITNFFNNSTAGNGTFINYGGLSGAAGGLTAFQNTSTAANATLIANSRTGGGGGGSVFLSDSSTGGTARVEVFGNGKLDISWHNAPGVATGSIEGSGLVFLGAVNLTVGSNHLDTTFSGVIQDGGGHGGTGGSLTKIGSDTLRLTGASTYTGGTTIITGSLLANNSTGSATGSGAVTVNNTATLGGNGTIHLDAGLGASLINNGTIAPGDSLGQLNVDGSVNLGSTSDLSIEIGGTNQGVDYDLLNITGGALILNGTLTVRLVNGFTPQQSDTFTIVATPSSIGGTFTNVQSGGRLNTADGNGSFQVTYSGINNVILSNFGPPGAPMAQDAFSRKVHGGAGTFDIPLLLTGNVGVECRSGGATNDYQMIVNFASTVTVESVAVTSGTGSVGSFSVSGPQVTVNLTGVTNVQRITVTLHNVNDGRSTGDVPVSMGVLVGDVNGNAIVNAADVSLTKSQVGVAVTDSNFREDVNADSVINSTDVALVKSEVGTALPP
jgi:hypothetical protein